MNGEFLHDEADQWIVYEKGGIKYTRKELETAFSQVHEEENWKLPISVEIEFTDMPTSEICRQLNMFCAAIEFFTGGAATVDCHPETDIHDLSKWKITAPGYYLSTGE